MSDSSARDRLALAVARLVANLSRVFRFGAGSMIGGRVALALSPKLVASLTAARRVVLISGTNGKTTTTAMVARGWGGDVATNETGSNMPPGHVGALAESKSARAVLEVDEGWLDRLLPGPRGQGVVPDVLVLLNLSRDQLDRATEVRALAGRWRTALEGLSSQVVANANDPLVVYAAEVGERVAWCDVPTPWTGDAISCPKCTRRLHFETGRWWCVCGFQKPSPITTTLADDLELRGQRYELALSLPGDFNRSNAAMALTALSYVDVEPRAALPRVSALASVAGRFSERLWRGRRLRLLLAKNPAGFAAMLATIDEGESDLAIAINARVADGKDPSWLYDVPFEELRGRRVFCLGERRLDLATRLEYGDVDAVVVEDDATLPPGSTPLSLLANYTAFRDWLEKTESA